MYQRAENQSHSTLMDTRSLCSTRWIFSDELQYPIFCIDGRLIMELYPGLHWYWNSDHSIQVNRFPRHVISRNIEDWGYEIANEHVTFTSLADSDDDEDDDKDSNSINMNTNGDDDSNNTVNNNNSESKDEKPRATTPQPSSSASSSSSTSSPPPTDARQDMSSSSSSSSISTTVHDGTSVNGTHTSNGIVFAPQMSRLPTPVLPPPPPPPPVRLSPAAVVAASINNTTSSSATSSVESSHTYGGAIIKDPWPPWPRRYVVDRATVADATVRLEGIGLVTRSQLIALLRADLGFEV
jgi:hypothetical protein